MPKIIEHLRQDLLACAADILQKDGYDALTLRRVAAACHIAVGTTYNYFPSKDVLAASAMLQDWLRALEDMQKHSGDAQTVSDALRAVYDGIAGFTQLYSKVWNEYSASAGIVPFLRARHQTLIGQLETVIEPQLERFDCLFCSALPGFLAEMLLSYATGCSVSFDELLPILHKLCAAVK